MAVPPRGGPGTNQYATKGASTATIGRSSAQVAAAAAAVDRPAGTAWAARNRGWQDPLLPGFEFPHRGTIAWVSDDPRIVTAADRDAGVFYSAPGATRSSGAGRRELPEEPDEHRTCFERDRDRVLHSTAFRRLAGKTQVVVAPENDMVRTRLTHALEVSQVACSIARACGLNVELTDAIAKAHDCGHTPCGHAGEDAFDRFMPGGFDHAQWGADVALNDLNLCHETLDGVRNHSWSHPAPSTPEATVVAFSDRIAYLAHDLDDAFRAGVLSPGDIPDDVAALVGRDQRTMIHQFVGGVISGVQETGRVCVPVHYAETLAALRDFNHERIYNRPEAAEQADRSIRMLQRLVEWHADRPGQIPGGDPSWGRNTERSTRAAVEWLAGATDRYAIRLAQERLGWRESSLPSGVG